MAKLAGDHVQVLVDGYELTGDSNRVSIPDQRDMYDVAAFGDAVHKFIPGRRSVVLEHSGYMNADVAQSHPALKGSNISGSVSVMLGQNATPVVGDPVYSLPIRQGKYSVVPAIGNFVPFSALFANRGELGGWGVALAVPVTFTNSTNGSAVNNGAATTQGGAAFLHVLTATATDRYTIVVEGSATGAFGGEQTTLATFTLDGSAIGSEFLTLSGTVHQYIRWKATRSSGAANNPVKIAVSLVRF
jgi:hypothetical protein